MRILKRDTQHIESETDSEGSWAISYGDMITLLLCFFILFFTTDSARDYQARLTSAMLAALNDERKSTEGAAPPLVLLDIGTKAEKGIDLTLVKTWNGSAHQVGEKLLIEFPGVSFFKSGRTELTREGRAALEDFTKRYMPYSGQYLANILAFTDHKKVLKSKSRRFDDNLELSALRAVATMRALQKTGIPLQRMRLGGHGELVTTAQELARLPASERDVKNLDLARRIVIVFEPEGRFGL